MEDVVRCCILNQYAGALRYMGHGLFDEKTSQALNELAGARPAKPKDHHGSLKPLKGDHRDFQKTGTTAVPLWGEHARYITENIARHASPMSNRTYDCNVHFLFEEMARRGLDRPVQGRIPVPTNQDQKISTLFSAMYGITVFRMYGRTRPFRHWAREDGRGVNGPKNRLPLPSEESRDSFKRYLCRSATEGFSLFGWHSKQHGGSVPDEWGSSLTSCQLLDKLAEVMEPAVKEFFDNRPSGELPKAMWKEAHTMLYEVLEETLPGHRENHRWLAQMILFDMEEIFEDPFGISSPEHMVLGFGSQECMKYFNNGGKYKKDAHGHKQQMIVNALKDIVKYVQDPEKVPEQCLQIMGYTRPERVAGEGWRVINIINGTEFDCKHAEHFMCKVYTQVSKLYATHRISAQPMASKPYCHPQVFRQEECDEILPENTILKSWMEKTCSLLPKLVETGNSREKFMCTPPQIIVVPGELIPCRHYTHLMERTEPCKKGCHKSATLKAN